MIGTIEAQIERFVPGFRDHILAKSAMDCTDLERTNANLLGGGITGGAMDLRQLLARPALRISPYSTPAKVSTSARLRRRPAVGYTACVATSPPTRPALPELGSTGASRSSGAVVREKRVRTF